MCTRSLSDRASQLQETGAGTNVRLVLCGAPATPAAAVGNKPCCHSFVTDMQASLQVCVQCQWEGPLLAWPWYAPVGAGTTVLVALVADRLVRRPGPGGTSVAPVGANPTT